MKKVREKLVEQNLELARRFMLNVLKDPGRAAHIPPGATLILYPVEIKSQRLRPAA